jgi:flavin-dependent dehydrogenase
VDLGDQRLLAERVIDASGRNSQLPRWLGEVGAQPIEEEQADIRLLYYSRFYRLRDPDQAPGFTGQIGGDIGFLKFGVFPGDGGTFSITMGTGIDDKQLRPVREPAVFDALAAVLPVTAEWMAAGVEPMSDDVALMARMVNRRRTFVVNDSPVATSILPIGDAAVCTNPLYGRGTSLALAHAFATAQAISATDDPTELAMAVDGLSRSLLDPWYRASVAQDRVEEMPGAFLAAVRSDPDVWRAFVRTFNLLAPPEAMLTDTHVQAKILEALAAGDTAPAAIEGAPSRDAVLAIIATSIKESVDV